MRYSPLLCILFLAVSSTSSFAQRPNHFYFVSPGIKLGYAFGEEDGFTYGIEVSYIKTGVYWTDPKYGIVLDIERVNNATRIHLGAEYIGGGLVGGEAGPSMVIRDDGVSLYGIGVSSFVLAIIILPYYSYTYMLYAKDFHDVGTYLKIPLQIEPSRDYTFPFQE